MNGLRIKRFVRSEDNQVQPNNSRIASPSSTSAIRLAVGSSQILRAVDPQAVIDRGQQVLGRDGAVGGRAGVRVAGADDLSAPNAAAGQDDAPDSRPVVAAARRVEPGRAAKFARGNHQRRFQSTTPLQIVDQGREGLIEVGSNRLA